MALLANLRTRVKRNVVTYINHSLPADGKIMVQVGQEINPDEIIARTKISGGFRKINLDQGFQLQKNLGQTIYKGELLALKKPSLFSGQKNIIAPTDGILDSLDEKTGELNIKFLPSPISIPAGVYGVVDFIDPQKGEVAIRTEVTQIIAPIGSGKARSGVLKILSKEKLVNVSDISASLENHIIVAGALIYKEALQTSVSLGVNGIITGGINAKDYRGMSGGRITFPRKMGSDIGISILVCEGFGSLPIADDIFLSLKKFENKFAILEGNRGILNLPSFEKECMDRIRKVGLHHVLQKGEEEIEAVTLKEGQNLRIIASPFMGQVGILKSIDKTPTRLDSGIVTYLINIEGKRKMRVPYTNVEIIS